MKTHTGPFLISPERYDDPRGSIGILHDHQVPFVVLRTFWFSNVPENTRRGGHAHRTSQQLLICIEGTIEVGLEDLTGKIHHFRLDLYKQGLYLPPMYWGNFTFNQNAKALCMASDHFDESDYIRNYEEFEQLKDATKNR